MVDWSSIQRLVSCHWKLWQHLILWVACVLDHLASIINTARYKGVGKPLQFIAFVCVLMSEYIQERWCAHESMCLPKVGISCLFQSLSTLILRQAPSLGLDLRDLDRVAGQHWDYWCMPLRTPGCVWDLFICTLVLVLLSHLPSFRLENSEGSCPLFMASCEYYILMSQAFIAQVTPL